MRRLKLFGFLFMAGCLVAWRTCLAGTGLPSDPLTRFTFTEYHMGVDARMVVYAPDQPSAEKACSAAFARIAVLDAIMSDYRKDSELMRLCDKSGGPPLRVSSDLFDVLKRAQELAKRTEGAFDVTVGPLIALWRAARKTGKLPDPVELSKARRLVGWQSVQLDECTRTVHLDARGMRLDLGGIAKGYACDQAQRVLKKHRIGRALVEMGGDLVVSGPPPGTEGWTIRVPNAGDDQGPKDLLFANCAISTSGDTEQFTVIGGVQYSHVVDPRTGQALTNRVQSTVVARDGLTSDPLATALTVLSRKEGEKLLRAYRGARSYVKVLGSDPQYSRLPRSPGRGTG